MKQITSNYKKATVDVNGNICKAIEHIDGTQFIQPFFEGEAVGWFVRCLSTTRKRTASY